jgi:hypothetical protein
MYRMLLLMGIAVVAVVIRTIWNAPAPRQEGDLRERVNTWENEGGQVPGVPPPHCGHELEERFWP